MKKILLVNQHSSNHGDEAAARALTRNLKDKSAEFTMLYNASGQAFKLDLPIEPTEVRGTQPISKLEKLQIMASIFVPALRKFNIFSKAAREEYRMIAESDLVISMPGGANLGLYEDWRYLWRLLIAQSLGKRTAVYSTSIGPFREDAFHRKAVEALKNADWLSLRDSKSIEYGNKDGLEFVHSIDTAFLVQDFEHEGENAPKLADFDIPFDPKSYCVIVPNNLKTGHPSFRSVPQEDLDAIYLALMNKVLDAGLNVVMLPQLFGNGNDRNYFKSLRERTVDAARVYVASDTILSDDQQFIIRNARFAIGARYHSIIFSINARTPFLCLSYENKMRYTLELLDRSEQSIDLTELASGTTHQSMIDYGTGFVDKMIAGEVPPADADKAGDIAKACYAQFDKKFLHDV